MVQARGHADVHARGGADASTPATDGWQGLRQPLPPSPGIASAFA